MFTATPALALLARSYFPHDIYPARKHVLLRRPEFADYSCRGNRHRSRCAEPEQEERRLRIRCL